VEDQYVPVANPKGLYIEVFEYQTKDRLLNCSIDGSRPPLFAQASFALDKLFPSPPGGLADVKSAVSHLTTPFSSTDQALSSPASYMRAVAPKRRFSSPA